VFEEKKHNSYLLYTRNYSVIKQWRFNISSVRFGPSLRYIELPIELITHTVLHELANKCPNLTHMLLDFSTAMQLHDFSEMQAFPTKLKYMCICLSEVIFMEGFMRKIYNFINGLEILHLIGNWLNLFCLNLLGWGKSFFVFFRL